MTESFRSALANLGIQCHVQGQGKLAVLVPVEPLRLDARDRRAIVALARANGFTNVCVELQPADGGGEGTFHG